MCASKQPQDIKKEIGKRGKNKNSNLALLQGLAASIWSNLKGWWDSLPFSVYEGSHKSVIVKFRTAAFINTGLKLKEKKNRMSSSPTGTFQWYVPYYTSCHLFFFAGSRRAVYQNQNKTTTKNSRHLQKISISSPLFAASFQKWFKASKWKSLREKPETPGAVCGVSALCDIPKGQ